MDLVILEDVVEIGGECMAGLSEGVVLEPELEIERLKGGVSETTACVRFVFGWTHLWRRLCTLDYMTVNVDVSRSLSKAILWRF